jgi:hypothetical protein
MRGGSDLCRLAILSHLYNLFMIIVSSCDIIRFRVMQYLSRYLHRYRSPRASMSSLYCRNYPIHHCICGPSLRCFRLYYVLSLASRLCASCQDKL